MRPRYSTLDPQELGHNLLYWRKLYPNLTLSQIADAVVGNEPYRVTTALDLINTNGGNGTAPH